MPRFEDYVEVEAEMDISPKEFVQACDEDELEELIQALQKKNFSARGISLVSVDNIFDVEWNETIKKLAHNRLRMSLEDINLIIAISKKY